MKTPPRRAPRAIAPLHTPIRQKNRDEVKRIREKYTEPAAKEESAIDRLRKLDARVTNRSTAVSLVFGILGTLILGCGMSLAMTDIGTRLSIPANLSLLLGICIGLLGILFIALAYPIYKRVLKKERARVAPEILRLTEELLK